MVGRLFLLLVGAACLAQGAFAQIKMATDGNVAVGSEPTFDRKLNVWSDYPSTLTSVIYARFNAVGSYNANAVFGRATTTAGYGYGGTFHGGARGLQGYATLAGSYERVGVYGSALDGTTNFGLYGTAGGGTAYGVYGTTTSGTTRYAGYFAGDVTITGNLVFGSDARLKEGVRSLANQDALARLAALRPVSYRYKPAASGFEDLRLPQGLHYGLMADEVAQVFPELVHEQVHVSMTPTTGEPGEERPKATSTTYQGVNYVELIPILIQAIKAQQEQIEALKAALQAHGIPVEAAAKKQ